MSFLCALRWWIMLLAVGFASEALASAGQWVFSQSSAVAWLGRKASDPGTFTVAFFCTPGLGTVGFTVPLGDGGAELSVPVKFFMDGKIYSYEAGVLSIPRESDRSAQAFLSVGDPLFLAIREADSLKIAVGSSVEPVDSIPIDRGAFARLSGACEGNSG